MGILGIPPWSRAVDFFWWIWGQNATTWLMKSFAGILFKVMCNNAVDYPVTAAKGIVKKYHSRSKL